MSKAYIIDGNSLLFRAYYATAYGGNEIMRTKDGIPTNAIFSFSNMLNKVLQSLKEGDVLFVGFDTGKATFRHKEDATYKANRKPCPEDLKIQMPIVRDLLKSLDVFTYEKEGYEADDICGTVAKMLGKDKYDVVIYTSDRDFLQLIDKNISIHIIKTGMSNIVVMNEKTMPELYGFSPMQIIDYKGLRGDASDNLPGIPGVGDKTAVKLIQQYGSFDAIVEAAKTMDSKVGESIVTNADMGRHCYEMARILTDVELPFNSNDLVYDGYSFSKVSEFANKYELKQFLNRLPQNLKKGEFNEKIEYETVSKIDTNKIKDEIAIALDIEPGNYNDAVVHGLSVFCGEKVSYINIDDLQKDLQFLDILKNKDIKKYCYDYKAIKVALHHLGIEIEGLYFDILLAAYLLDSTLINSVDSVMHYFGADISSSKDDSLSLFDNSDPEKCSKIAYYSYKLANKSLADLDALECLKLYQEVEIPLTTVLTEMEIEGFPIDVDVLERMGETFKAKIDEISKQIYKAAGQTFNIDSPKQVGEILYDKLGLDGKKNKSTSVDALKGLIGRHEIVDLILAYRKYSKLLSTYVTGLSSHVYGDGKLHAIFNQALTQTGRLSSSDPNLQNISVRDEDGKMIRKAFYYKDDNYSILSLDYSQIELRILASLSNCKKLQDVFLSGKDIHAATAMNVFHNPNPSDNERRRAKAVNFGIIYGISDWGLSEQIGCSIKEAKSIISAFYEAYPEIGAYFQKITAEVTKNGYVTTLLGRRRYLREVHDSNYQVREFARRAAMNAPIQGTAADLIKIAMIKVNNALKEKGLKTKLILQIHDELLFKVPSEEKDIVLPLVKDIMEHAMDLPVKLEVDGGFGHTWYDAK